MCCQVYTDDEVLLLPKTRDLALTAEKLADHPNLIEQLFVLDKGSMLLELLLLSRAKIKVNRNPTNKRICLAPCKLSGDLLWTMPCCECSQVLQ